MFQIRIQICGRLPVMVHTVLEHIFIGNVTMQSKTNNTTPISTNQLNNTLSTSQIIHQDVSPLYLGCFPNGTLFPIQCTLQGSGQKQASALCREQGAIGYFFFPLSLQKNPLKLVYPLNSIVGWGVMLCHCVTIHCWSCRLLHTDSQKVVVGHIHYSVNRALFIRV